MTFLSNQLAPWVDPRVKFVKVAALKAYLLRQKWEEVASPRSQMLLFKGPVGDDGEPIIQAVPSAERGSDYTQRVIDLITNLAVIEDRYAVEVLNDILQGEHEDGHAQPGSSTAKGLPSTAR
ncbi:MAG: hypothetical protein L0Z62_00835 [Gemmataceae bacterium]|nr:hypothetical protein [Gemmataceae bacterium]